MPLRDFVDTSDQSERGPGRPGECWSADPPASPACERCRDEQTGAGLGFVDVFSPHGRLLNRLEAGSWFNAPWGLALASSDFGSHSHDVLVGQFGSGEILAFDAVTGRFNGKLQDANNNPIHIDGLWAIAFGNDASAGPATTLFFTAGPDEESNGLFGTLTAVENVHGNGR